VRDTTETRHPEERRRANRGLCHCVSYYRVIQDARQGVPLIRILPLESNPRSAIRTRVTDLIVDWGHYITNKRRIMGYASPITKKSKMHFNVACRRFGCQLEPLLY
jgi:hypothetical protein